MRYRHRLAAAFVLIVAAVSAALVLGESRGGQPSAGKVETVAVTSATGAASKLLPVPSDTDQESESEELGRLDQFWNDRLTYPTGDFDPAWVRTAVAQDAAVEEKMPAGGGGGGGASPPAAPSGGLTPGRRSTPPSA